MHQDVYDIWQASLRPKDWVLDGLIQMGDQVVLAGPPKSYKSLWASQLAVGLALGEADFLGWRIPKPRRVLYISMEMGDALVGERIVKQMLSSPKLPPPEFAEEREAALREIPLYHIFGVDERVAIDVCDRHDFTDLKLLIEEKSPEVVIFDSFVRFHRQDENSNMSMSWAMRQLRELCLIRDPDMTITEKCVKALDAELEAEGLSRSLLEDEEYILRLDEKIAAATALNHSSQESVSASQSPDDSKATEYAAEADSPETSESPLPEGASDTDLEPKHPRQYRTGIILHHSRKEQQFGKQSYSVSAMRGASTIHSEVDLAIAAFQLGGKISLNYSARKILAPNFQKAELQEDGLRLRILTTEELERTQKKEKQAKEPKAVARVPLLVHSLIELSEQKPIDGWTWDEVQAKAQTVSEEVFGMSNVFKKYEKHLKELGLLMEEKEGKESRYKLMPTAEIYNSDTEEIDAEAFTDLLIKSVLKK